MLFKLKMDECKTFPMRIIWKSEDNVSLLIKKILVNDVLIISLSNLLPPEAYRQY